MNSEKIYSILLYTIAGDALGTPLDGLSKGHIASVLKEINGYADPLPALKGKTEKWKKPGLYSCVSQLIVLFSMVSLSGHFSVKKYMETVALSPEFSDTGLGIFRYPESAVKNFIQNCFTGMSAPVTVLPSQSLPLLVLHLGLFSETRSQAILNSCELAKHISSDVASIAGAALYAAFIWDFMSQKTDSFSDLTFAAGQSAAESASFFRNESSAVFATGLNPDSLASAAALYAEAFTGSESRLLNIINSCLKTPASRLTVPHPLALIPYAVRLSGTNGGDLFKIAQEGGSVAALTALAGSFIALTRSVDELPSALVDGLVNRKRLLSVIESISKGSVSNRLIGEFIESELQLTAKAFEELKARNKNKEPKKKTKTGKTELPHTVEAWTKLDKAKWKKEKRRLDGKNQ